MISLKKNTPKIKATMTATPKKARPPKYATFEIKIVNDSGTILNAVSVSDQISLFAKYVSDSKCGKVERNNVKWPNIGSLKPGNEMVIALTVFLDNNPGNGFWINEASVGGTSAEGVYVEAICAAKVKHDVQNPRRKKRRGDGYGDLGDGPVEVCMSNRSIDGRP